MGVDRTKVPPVGRSVPFRPPRFAVDELPNGVRVWTVSHRRAPVLAFRLLVPVGSADDPSGQSGLAGLTAALLDEGTALRSDVELHQALMELGAHLAVHAGSDATVVSLTTLPKHAARALELLIEVVSTPRFDPTDCERVRDLRLTRLRQMRQVPSAVADRVFLEQVYPNHPYGHLAIGTEEALCRLTAEDLTAFHRRCYGAPRWTLVAVGDLAVDELRELAMRALSQVSFPAVDTSLAVRPAPPDVGRKLVFMPRAGAVQSEIQLGHAAVPRSSPDYHALLVLNMVLGGQFISRVNRNLREAKGYTYGARTAFEWRLGAGPFAFESSVQTDATADAVAEAIRELEEIRGSRPPSPDELVAARAALTRGFPQQFETANQIARIGTTLALHQLPPDEMDTFVERVEAVGADEVSRMASIHLRPDRLVVVIVGSPDDVLPSLPGLGFGEPITLHPSSDGGPETPPSQGADCSIQGSQP